MFKAIAVYVKDPTRSLGNEPHISIKSDAVVRQVRNPMPKTATLVIDVEGDDNYNISDAQCQSTVVTVMAAQLNYKIDSEKVRCYGMEWDEILRRA